MLKGDHLHYSSLSDLPQLDYDRFCENRELVELLLDQLPQGILLARARDGAILLANRAAKELHNQFPDYMTGEGYDRSWRLLTADQTVLPAAQLPSAKAIGGQSVREQEYIAEFADGTRRRHTISAAPLYGADREIFATLITFADSPGQRQTAEDLPQSEQHYRELFEQTNDIIYTLDLEGNVRSFNRAASTLFEYTDAEAQSLHIRQIVAPDHLQYGLSMMARRLAGEQTPAYEIDVVTKQGRRVALEVNNCLLIKDGKPVGIQGIARDITERKRKDDEMRAIKERFSKAFNASPYPMSIIRIADRRYIDVNDSAVYQTGFLRQERLGKTVNELGIFRGEEAHNFWEQFLAQGFVRNFEMAITTKSGEKRFGLFSAEKIEIDGEPCALVSKIDITEQRRAERVKTAAYKISEAANATDNLPELYAQIHQIVGELMDVRNFYIALVDWEAGLLRIPYFFDEVDQNPQQRTLRKGLTEYVLRTQQPLHAKPDDIRELKARGEVETIGTLPVDWLGVPLKTKAGAIGVLTVQSYTRGLTYGEEEKQILIFVSTQVALAIERKRAEEDLRASQQWFSRVFNLSPNPMGINRLKDGCYVDVNQSFLEATQYAYDEVVGKTPDELGNWASPEQKERFIQLIQERRKIHNLELDYQTKFGDRRCGLVSAEIIDIKDEKYLLTTLGDITNRKQAENNLRASEERFSKAFNSSPYSLSISSLEGVFIDVNDRFLQDTGYRREEVVGRSADEVNLFENPEKRQRFREIVKQAGSIKDMEIRFRTKSGDIRLAQVSGETITLGGEICWLATANDITERKRTEEALRVSEERFSKAFNLSPLPMSLMGLESGKILDINDSFLKATGHSRQEVIGQSATELGLWVKEQDRDSGFNLILANQRINNLEGRYRRKDGSVRTILFSAETITIDDAPCILTVMNDITERKQKEEALKASEERFSSTFYLSPNPMCISTLEGGFFIDVNEAFAAALGGTRQELIGRTSKEINFFVDYAQRHEAIEVVKGKQRYHIDDLEIQYRKLNGEVRIGLLSAEIIEIEGRPCLLTVVNDITERKRQEEELLVARREWQATFDALSDEVMLLDKEDHLLRANKAFIEGHGLAYEAMIGCRAKELEHKNNRFISSGDCPLCQLRAKKISGTIELPAGVITDYPVLASSDPIFNSQGDYVGCVQVTRNLSALYSARQEAEQERISLKATIEQMAEGLMIFDETPSVIRANSSAQNIFGFTLEEMINDKGGKLTEGRFADREGRLIPAYAHPVRTALREQRTIRATTVWYLRPDRQRVLLSITTSPFFNEQGKLTGAVSLVRDITQQQRELERLQQADKLRALGQLASGVAHNFNNALAAVIGYSQLALRKTEDPEVQKHLRVIEQSSKDAARMVERIQNFSRTRSKHDEFIPARISDIVRDAVDITRPRWQYDAEAQGIKYTVTLQWQANLDFCVSCDPSELREVFVNIIFNALDAMPAGGFLAISGVAQQESILISFKDTGTGMTEEVKSRVFDPFFTTKGTAGLGLGLSESYRIIERHLGQLDAESQPQSGTIFTVTLPLMPFASFGATRDTSEYALAKKRFLVVDDEKLVRHALSSLLEELGHEVFQAATAQQAIELTKLHQFDLIFTDLAMPDVDGIATAQKVKALQPNVKIVLMSGYSTDKVLERMQDTDCIDAPMSKPFRIDEVQSVIKNLVGVT